MGQGISIYVYLSLTPTSLIFVLARVTILSLILKSLNWRLLTTLSSPLGGCRASRVTTRLFDLYLMTIMRYGFSLIVRMLFLLHWIQADDHGLYTSFSALIGRIHSSVRSTARSSIFPDPINSNPCSMTLSNPPGINRTGTG